jgi:hypothetical protein
MLVGSGTSTGLYTGVEPLLPFVLRTAKKPAGLQICTVVETFRDLEVPPASPSYEDRANIQSGTVPYRVLGGPGSAAHRHKRVYARLRRAMALRRVRDTS